MKLTLNGWQMKQLLGVFAGRTISNESEMTVTGVTGRDIEIAVVDKRGDEEQFTLESD